MEKQKKALAAVILGNSIFGLSFLFSKVALNITMPSVVLAFRFTFAFVILNIVVFFGKLIKKKDGRPLVAFSLKKKPLRYAVILALFQPVIYFFAESNGMKYTSSSFAGTIIAVIPVVGIILDVLIMKVQVTKKQIFCALASVAGVALTTLGAEDMKSSFLGLLLLLVAVVTGSLFYVFSKKAGIWFNALERTYVMFGIGSGTYLLAALFQCRHDMGGTIGAAIANPTLWICMLYLSGASSVGAFLLLNYGSSYVTVSEASLCANFSTVISIVAGIVVLREAFSLPQMIGAATILISVYLANIGEKESTHSKK